MKLYSEVDAAIHYIHRNLHDLLHLSELASYVSYSSFHFTRIFKAQTGLSLLHYISALRLQRAKELLLHTKFSVRDISLEIGQMSLGTFTTRFTGKVGVTPAIFRRNSELAEERLIALRKLDNWSEPASAVPAAGTIDGTITADIPFAGVILIGLFAKPIPEGIPLIGTLVSSLGSFRLTGVKPGIYYLMATTVSWDMQANDFLLPHRTLRTRSLEPLVVEPFRVVQHQHVRLRMPSPADPPILISLPLLMERFMERMRV